MRRLVLLLIAAMCGTAGHPACAQILNARLKKSRAVIRRVLVLPSQLELVFVTRNGTAGISEKTAALIDQTLRKELVTCGLEVLPNPLEQARDDESRYAVADLQSKYDVVRAQLSKKPKDLVNGRYTLGDYVASFGPGASAEALVFVRGKGGMKITSPLWFGYPFEGNIAFVDPKTGDVLAWTRFWSGSNIFSGKPEGLSLDLRTALRKMPFPKRPKLQP